MAQAAESVSRRCAPVEYLEGDVDGNQKGCEEKLKKASKKSTPKKSAKKSARKYSFSAGKQVKTEMHEMKRGTLKSGRSGKK